MYPLVPSQRQPDDAPLVPTLGRSLPTYQVEASATKRPIEPDPEETRDLELLDEAHERFRACVEYDSAWRKSATDELNFVDKLDHWTQQQKDERVGRPCLVFDRIGPSIDQVVNDARQNPPEPRISPVGSGSDKWTAEILQGLIRNIDNDSSADIAYMTAYEHAVKVGRGWWRIDFEFENDVDFTQKILVKRVPNPFSVYPDPAADEFDYSDMKYCFLTEDMDRTAFEEAYPDAYAGAGEFQGLSDKQRDDWFPKGAVRVAEYWYVRTVNERMALLGNGKSVAMNDVPEAVNIISTRTVKRRYVFCSKITGCQVLKTTAWPGKWIPIIPVLGREVLEDGKRRLRGMIRAAMDANLSYDYMRSKQVEAVGLAPIAPYIVAEGQIEGYEKDWGDANRKPFSVLKYKPIDAAGQPVPPPQRNMQEPAIQAITIAVQHADNDIKSTLSTYDASLGNAGPESSGRAILARQKEGDNAHFHYHDNLGRSMRHTGRVILDLIPHIYSEARAVSIFDPDGSIQQVAINQQTVHQGVVRIFDLANSTLKYDITIGSGPSYASRRAQGQESLREMVQFLPVLQQRAPDLLLKALDVPDADQFADRVRPPDVQHQQDGDGPPVDPRMQAQMQQQGQMIQLLSQHVTQLTEVIKGKTLEMESKERIATQTNLTKILVAEAGSKSAEAQQLAAQDHDGIKHELEARNTLAHANLDFEQDQVAHDQERQHLQQMEQLRQQHEAQLAQQQQDHEKQLAQLTAAQQPPQGAQPSPAAQPA